MSIRGGLLLLTCLVSLLSARSGCLTSDPLNKETTQLVSPIPTQKRFDSDMCGSDIDNDVLTAELSALEIGIGTLAACLPIYRPIYNRYFCTTTSADCGNQDPKTYGQLLEEQSSIKMKMRLIGKPSNQNATSVHTISEANSKAEPSQSTTIRLKKIPHPMDEESGTGIMVTKEFVVTGPAPSSSIAQCQDSFCCK